MAEAATVRAEGVWAQESYVLAWIKRDLAQVFAYGLPLDRSALDRLITAARLSGVDPAIIKRGVADWTAAQTTGERT